MKYSALFHDLLVVLGLLHGIQARGLSRNNNLPRSFSQRQRSIASLRELRGGQQPASYPYQPDDELSNYPPPSSSDDFLNPPDENDPYHETVQERVESWRNKQREYAAAVEHSPRDAQGRMKLLTSVSRGSRALIFFILMVRDIHLYEVADQTKKGLARLLCVVPLTFLFFANMAGIVASLTSPTHSGKKRLKAILNLDKMLEFCLLLFYFLRLTLFVPQHTPREIYMANIFHSVFFIVQSQAFTRLSWDENSAQPINSYATASYNGSPNAVTTNNNNNNNNYVEEVEENPGPFWSPQEDDEYQQSSTNTSPPPPPPSVR